LIGELAACIEDGHSQNQSSTTPGTLYKPLDSKGIDALKGSNPLIGIGTSTSKDYNLKRLNAIFTEVPIFRHHPLDI
jgi:hypothetical protein